MKRTQAKPTRKMQQTRYIDEYPKRAVCEWKSKESSCTFSTDPMQSTDAVKAGLAHIEVHPSHKVVWMR